MARLLTLLTLALLTVAEIASLMWLAGHLGAGGALAVLALDMFVGVVLMRRAARGPVEDRGWRMAGGAIIALPGLVLDLAGALLLIPPTRQWIKSHVMRSTESALRRRGVSVVTVTDAGGVRRTTVVPGDVIGGEVVVDDTPTSDMPTDRGSSPNPGPKVVRGEIAGTQES